jgi:sec-independent protein translocase protein TatA
MFGSFGWMELLLILFIVLIIFGAGKLPQLGEGVGKAIKGFKRSVNEAEPAAEDAVARVEASPPAPAPTESAGAQIPHPTPGPEAPPAGPQDSTSRQA